MGTSTNENTRSMPSDCPQLKVPLKLRRARLFHRQDVRAHASSEFAVILVTTLQSCSEEALASTALEIHGFFLLKLVQVSRHTNDTTKTKLENLQVISFAVSP